VWTFSLCAYQLRLINYNYISGEAWIFIFAAWIALYMGTAWAGLFDSSDRSRQRQLFPGNQGSLGKAIIVLSCAGMASSVVLAWNIVHSLDSQLLLALIDQGNKIYTMRFDGDLSGLMYVGFLPYAASALAGAYASRIGRITFVSVLPLLAMTVDGILSMQRGGILISIVLFVAGAYITPSKTPLYVVRWQIAACLGLLLAGFLYVTMVRGVPAEFEGQGATLNRISDVVPSLPSLYMYVSAPPAGLSAYLQHPASDGNSFLGRYTFAPAYRLLAKLGWNTYVPYYTEFYSTPVPINSCTYLREIHSDFGSSGILGVPFCLGALMTLLEARRSSLAAQMVLAHLYVFVVFSFTLLVAITGYWYISLMASSVIGLLLDRAPKSIAAGAFVVPRAVGR
jgi:oligosaccharide repeat unit polymerase